MDRLCGVGYLTVAGLQTGVPGYTYRYTDSGTGQGGVWQVDTRGCGILTWTFTHDCKGCGIGYSGLVK